MSSTTSTVSAIRPEDIRHLRLQNHPRIDEAMALAIVVQSPGSSFWHPGSGEFIIVTPWRHRQDILAIHTSGGFLHEETLIRAAVEHAQEVAQAFLTVDAQEARPSAFYDRNGFSRVEQIITYEHRHPAMLRTTNGQIRQRFERVLGTDDETLDQVVALDHIAFPWLWRNSPAEFRAYLQIPGVEVWAGTLDGELTSYVGLTHYRHWGHLDRIATRPDRQGQGLGREALNFASTRMVLAGARQIALSTQADNRTSRAMYERYGFVRTQDDDYHIYGVIFDQAVFRGEQ